MSSENELIQIRETSERDLLTLVDLLHRAFQEYEGVLDPPSGTHKESAESVRIKMETGGWVLAERAGQAVGCVWYEARGDYVYIGRLSVPPEFRGQGIANALLDYVEQKAHVHHILRLQLGVRLALPAMRATYERRGYRFLRYETHEGYNAPTYVTMEKVLGDA